MVEMVAELGSNWCGSIELGKRLIKECKDAGASAIKMQFLKSDLYQKDDPIWQEFPNLKDFELTYEKAKELKEYADEIGIDWFCSCFYPDAVDWCEDLDVKRYKISHRRSALDIEIMRKIANTRKPIVVSITESESSSVIFGVSLFIRTGLTFLHCVPLYPAPKEKVNFESMAMGVKWGGVEVGYSNHVVGKDGIEICKEIIEKGADMVEIHTMLDESYRDKSPDGCCSLTIEELEKVCEKH